MYKLENIETKELDFKIIFQLLGMYVQSLAIKLAVSISVIRKLAVVFIPVEIQKFV